jgi:hypothetical protein
VGCVGEIEERGGKSGPVAGPILVRKIKKWPKADMGNSFLYNFQNPFYQL